MDGKRLLESIANSMAWKAKQLSEMPDGNFASPKIMVRAMQVVVYNTVSDEIREALSRSAG